MTAHSNENRPASGASLKSYVLGFALSILLTFIPLGVVMGGWMEGTAALVTILIAAVLQFIVQLFFFMHLREGEDARWNKLALVLGAVILILIVGGSIWIMTYNAVAH